MKITRRHAARVIFSFIKPYAPGYIYGVLLYGTQMFTMPLLISILISQLTEAMLSGDPRLVWTKSGVLIGIFVIFFLMLALAVYFYVKQTELAQSDLKNKLFRSFVHTSIEENAHSGESFAAINTDAKMALRLLDDSLVPFLQCVVSIVCSAGVIFSVDYRLGLISLLIGGLAFLLQFRFSKPLREIAEGQLEGNRGSVKCLSDFLAGAAVVRVFNLEEQMLITFDRENQKLLKLNLRGAMIAMWQNLFSTTQGWMTLVGIFGVGGLLVAAGRLSIASLMLVPNLTLTLANGMSGLGSAWAGLQGPLTASVQVTEKLEQGERLAALSRTKTEVEWNHDTTLRAEGLSFSYRGSDHAALKNISVVIPPNKMTAFVGASGCGKSTLLRALIGLYERESLPLSIGNVPYDKMAIAEWRNLFAYVDQSCKLFDMTVRENIALGHPGATQEEIVFAAKQAQADEFINTLPHGYDTPCGEKGASLSGGQKQRIAIARALVRKAPILVFDEATSALDAEAEQQIMQTIKLLRNDHTILLVTHNLCYVDDADQIIVLKDGQIEESGTHDELLTAKGEYSRLLLKDESAAT